jgi:inner membrane protein
MTTPTAFNNVLWNGVFDADDRYWIGYYSWFDKTINISFRSVEKNHFLIDDIKDDEKVKVILWFMNNYYKVTGGNGIYYLYDMRYGPLNGWNEKNEIYVFSYKVTVSRDNGTKGIDVQPFRHPPDITSDMLVELFERIKGI